MKKFFDSYVEHNRLFWTLMGFLLLYLIGLLDYYTGVEVSFSLFYVFPIAWISWITNLKFGILAAVIGAILWLTAESLAGAIYSNPVILYWNALVRLGIFMLMSLSTELGKNLEREAASARTDFMTGALNSRSFHECLQLEIERIARYPHPLTIAYLDVDNFKLINDRFGHSVGDEVLHTIVDSLQQTLRKTDIVARVGGDEFALLLPETDMSAAEIVISKAQDHLLRAMHDNQWSVTTSMGVVTFTHAPRSVDFALDIADKLMYAVKENGKNNVIYAIHN